MALIETTGSYVNEDRVVIGANGTARTIGRDQVKDILIGQDVFDLGFDITPSKAEQTGEILRFGTSLIMDVQSDGELRVRAETDGGEMVHLVTSGAGFNDVSQKSVGLSLADGELSVVVDGETVGRIDMPSPITVNGWGGHDLYIGNPWSTGNFQSVLSGLNLSGPEAPEPTPVETAKPVEQGPVVADLVKDQAFAPESEAVTDGGAQKAPEPGGNSNVRVSDLQGLYAALAEATGGDTILLEPGDYGTLSLTGKSGFDFAYPSDVTIASADLGNPATFTGLDIRGASHLVFEDVVFDYTFSQDDPIYSRPFSIMSSSDIAIRDSAFTGDVAKGVSEIDDGHGWAIGLSVRGSEDVTVEGTEISGFWRGAVITDSDDVTLRGNDLHDIRMDGLNFAAVQGVVIEDNFIHDFDRAWGSADHADMIQFWTNGTDRPSTDIVIRGNQLDIGEGGYTHSIFMRNDQVDQGIAGREMFYQNVTIEDNMIANAHLHGIAVGETDGLVIRSNTVLHADGGDVDGRDSSVEIPRISVSAKSTDVTVTSNVTSNLVGWSDQSDWSVSMNAFVQDQDPAAPGYYEDVFISSSLLPQNGQHKPQALPGGMVDLLDAGASVQKDVGAGLEAKFQVTAPEGETATRIFDAGYSALDGAELPEDATYLWTFSDGETASGKAIERAYTAGADDSVTLQVTLPDGARAAASHSFSITGAEMLSYEHGQDFTADDGTVFTAPGFITQDGLDLGDSGVGLEIDQQHVENLVGADEFTVSFGIDADSRSSDGEVFRYGTSLVVGVTNSGELSVSAMTEDGRVRLTTEGAKLNNTAEHDVELSFANGRLGVSVDGVANTDVAMSSGLVKSGNHGLYFGNPWGRDNFEGTLTSFEMTQNASDFEPSHHDDSPGFLQLDMVPPL